MILLSEGETGQGNITTGLVGGEALVADNFRGILVGLFRLYRASVEGIFRLVGGVARIIPQNLIYPVSQAFQPV